jgi:LPS sulfotransferase NodH
MDFSARIRLAVSILLHGEPVHQSIKVPPLNDTELAEIRQFFPRQKFFILGFARSGTTILMRLIGLHPQIHCNYQAHFFTRPPALKALVDNPEIAHWFSRRNNRWNHGRDLSPLVLRAAADIILERDAALFGKQIVGDKSPTTVLHGQSVRDMHDIYPDAKLIYIVRDGRDVLISERIRNFVEDNKFLLPEDRKIIQALQNNPSSFLNGQSSIFTESFIRRVAQNWVNDLLEIDEEGQRLYSSAFLTVRYEDLLTDPFSAIKRIWAFLNVQVEPGLEKIVLNEIGQNQDEEWQAHRNETIASFLPKGQTGNWRERFTQRDRQLFKDIAGEMLIKWGYEKDENW